MPKFMIFNNFNGNVDFDITGSNRAKDTIERLPQE